MIPDGVAYTVTKILEQNVLYGTGTRANFGRPAAGKTGTTDDHADAWFCGYLPNLAGDRLGRLPAGRDPDAERARHRGRRRQLPGRDLAPVHGAGDAVLARRRTSRCRGPIRTGRRSQQGQYDIVDQSRHDDLTTTTTTTGDDQRGDDDRTDAADDRPRAGDDAERDHPRRADDDGAGDDRAAADDDRPPPTTIAAAAGDDRGDDDAAGPRRPRDARLRRLALA